MAQKVLSGHRVKVSRLDPVTGRSSVVGIFSDVTYSSAYGAQAVFILGRTSAAALQYTHAEPINVRMRAWHVVDHGPYVDGMLPKLQDLLKNDYTQMTLLDRQREIDGVDADIGTIKNLIITGFDSSVSIRNLKEYTVSGMAILYSDESAKNVEGAAAADLP